MDINQDRLWSDIQELGRIGRADGGITVWPLRPRTGRHRTGWKPG